MDGEHSIEWLAGADQNVKTIEEEDTLNFKLSKHQCAGLYNSLPGCSITVDESTTHLFRFFSCC